MPEEYVTHALIAFWVLLHLVTECAWRVGIRRRVAGAAALPTEPATALLAVLGLLLAFTVSMAVTRFDTRKQLVIEEANAIGTAELRSRLLPPAAASRSRELFEAYLDRRVEWGTEARNDVRQGPLLREAADIQSRLWHLAAEATTPSPTPVSALYESALNDMFDIAAERAYVRGNRVPDTLLLALGLVAVLAIGMLAGVLGRNTRTGSLNLHLLAFSVWLVIALIVDLDRPRRGAVQVSQEPLTELREEWRRAPRAR